MDCLGHPSLYRYGEMIMKTIIVILTLAASTTLADGNSCSIPAPAAPPTAERVVVILPPDGGSTRLSDGGTTTGCAVFATGSGGTNLSPGIYSIGNVKCATAASMGQQAFANDNGWADGGAP